MLSGMILSLVLSHSIWIDMRINTSLFLPLSVLAWTGAGIFLKKTPSALIILILQAGLGMVLLYTCGTDISAWALVPAILTREGLFLKFMGLSSINPFLVFFFLAGNWTLISFPNSLKKPHSLDLLSIFLH